MVPLLLLLTLAAAPAARSSEITSACGAVFRNEAPYRAIGINYFDVFYHLLSTPDDESFMEDFRKLRESGIPFVRFAANGFWPNDNRLYFENKKAYFGLLDRVVHAAENTGLGLVPTLFWNIATVPDLVGEPLSAWADPRSRTRAFMRTYTEEVVGRYRGSPAIWLWEFGNEYNNQIDLPHSAHYRPRVVPKRGTPPSRSDKDDLTASMLMKAAAAWVHTVRKLDPDHPVSSGGDIPRHDAYELRTGRRREIDSRAEWTQELIRQNQPFSVISVHCYIDERRFFGDERLPMPDTLFALQQIAAKQHKPVFVGEFGALGDDEFRTLLRAVEESGVALAAVWNFSPRKSDWSISFKNERAWMVDALKAANERLTHVCTTRPCFVGQAPGP